MKILRVVNGIPMEFELTPQEICDVYAERNLDIIQDNLLYALENGADNDDPDTDDPMAAKNILAALKRSPILTKKVALQFSEFISDVTVDMEVESAIDAYKYIVKSLEGCK
jgi:hypothetical protein